MHTQHFGCVSRIFNNNSWTQRKRHHWQQQQQNSTKNTSLTQNDEYSLNPSDCEGLRSPCVRTHVLNDYSQKQKEIRDRIKLSEKKEKYIGKKEKKKLVSWCVTEISVIVETLHSVVFFFSLSSFLLKKALCYLHAMTKTID